MAEAGVPGYEVLEWNPLLAPAGLAPDVRKTLVNAIRKAASSRRAVFSARSR
jgi:tripartite-type tricarboxylate transporter receptor subunit TctC